MVLTNRQEEGLRVILERYKAREKYTIISGYAGSGKSTLVRFAIEALDIDEDDVGYACYTGKAAEVLRKKGNKNAITLHKLLYESVPKADGTFFRKRKPFLDYKIIVADECSMIPKEMVDQLNSYYGIYVIYLGDPFQIPPINPESDNHLLDKPHCFLDEIMRQAAESEIIRVSMDIRNGIPLQYMDGNEVKIISKNDLNTGMLQWADQILVATNATRKSINNQMRELLGRGQSPEEGDKVICDRNYWECFSDGENPAINGTIGYLDNIYESFIVIPKWVKNQKSPVKIIRGNVITDWGDTYHDLQMDKNLFLTGEKSLDRKVEYQLGKRKMAHLIPKEFEYGYAITGHRAQGSQWPQVLVIEERFPFEKVEHARWLYTAVTRAEDKLVLVRNN